MLRLNLSRSPSRNAVPLVALPVCAFEAWKKKQSQAVRLWLKTQAYQPRPGRFLVIPGKDGSPAMAVVCVSSPVGLWDLSALPRALPRQSFRLEGDFTPEELHRLGLGWLLGGYRFSRYKKDEEVLASLCVPKETDTALIVDKAEAVAMARDLVSTPAQDMGPADLAASIKEVGKSYGAKVTEIVGDDLLKKNYPAIHAVGRASPAARAPRLVDLTWGNPKHPRVTLIGKGVCFDTGGLDLKTSGGMILMRKDKGGAASALGVARLVMQRRLPVRLRLLIPALENAVSGDAFRPSDILTMRSGVTVEVGNTDAEGRLVVADALAEAVTEKPDLIVDFTTLTGAARAVMGTEISAFCSNDDSLANDLIAAGAAQADPMCRIPLYEGYEPMLESRFADLNSSPGSPYAQPIVAALFLQRFLPKEQKWIHFDFMGYNVSGKPGRPEGGEAMALRAVFALLEKRFPPL